MRVSRAITVAVLARVGLQGCTTPLSTTLMNPAERRKQITTATHAQASLRAKSLDEEFQTTLALCKNALVGFDQKAAALSWFQFAIAIAGTIAGSIIGPYYTAIDAAKNSGLIAAMSGTAGAANTAQTALAHVGLSTDLQREARADLRKNAVDALSRYGGTDDQKEAALKQATIACSLLPGVATTK